MMPDSIRKTKNASTTLSRFGVFSTYESYSVVNGDEFDDEDEGDAAAEARDFAETADDWDLEPLGGMVARSLCLV